jgi:hypothetical protein
MRTAFLVALLSVTALGGCAAIQPARMALPESLALSAETVPFSGISGRRTGAFQLGPYSGRFTRSDERLAMFDPLFEQRDGTTDFELTGPDIDGAIEAACRGRTRAVTLGVIRHAVQPMTFSCVISSSDPSPAELEVRASRERADGRLTGWEREGYISLEGVSLQIRSVRDVEGTALQLETPIGYVFEHEGIPVGAVETNGRPVVRYRPGASASVKRAVTVGATALALFWDPRESALGREAEP